MNAGVKELAEYLRRSYPGAKYRSVYEAGYCGYWIDRQLRRAGIENIVVSPADVPTKNKERRRKTDHIDASKLARELSNNSLDAIYIPTETEEALRSLARLRNQLTKDQTRIKNRIKALLSFLGIAFPENKAMKHWSRRFIVYLENITIPEEPASITLNKLLDNLKYLRGELVKIVHELRRLSASDEKTSKTMKHLISVPGIGFITAISLYTEIMDINRFPRIEKLNCFIGFIPDTDSSGEEENELGMTLRHNRYLRSMIIEAAWTAVRVDPSLTEKYVELVKRMSKQRAIVRIAKKLLSRIVHVWQKDEDYVLSVAA